MTNYTGKTGNLHAGHWPGLVGASGASWLMLLFGCIALPFSYGANNIPYAAWIAPVFLLRFVRTQRLRVAMPVIFAAQIAAIAFQMRGMFPASGATYWLMFAVAAAPALVPYAVDRSLNARLRGISSTLAFPLTLALVDYLCSFGSYGSWGAVAYSQYGELPLLQIVSITGLWGVNFVIGWFAAVCNLTWEEGWSASSVRAAVAFLVTIASIVLLGGLRLTSFSPDSPTVRVASLSAKPSSLPPALSRLILGKAGADDLTQVRDWARSVDEDLLTRADQAARNGARIIFWGEANAPVLKEDEAALLAEGAKLAARDKVYLGMALGIWRPGQDHVLENAFVMIEPDGHIAWKYNKTHPVPGREAAMLGPSAGKLRVLDTPYGKLTVAICFDADFPQTMIQAGQLGADIILNPANEWAAIDPWHAQMASFRAIEQGASIIHHGTEGFSAAFDYHGNRLSSVDYFRSGGATMIADVPTRGVRTIYTLLGDWFAWLCAGGLAMLVVTAFVFTSKNCALAQTGSAAASDSLRR